MSRIKITSLSKGVCVAAFLLLVAFRGSVFAAEGDGNWRGIYDVVMLWVNFSILVFLFIKFAKNPIKNFLKGQQEEVAKEIGELEKQRNDMIEKLKNARDDLEKSHVRLDEIKERIIHEGEKNKQAIVEDARHQSRLMMEDAKRKIDTQILMAKKGFREELIDAAVKLAMEKLPGIVTDNDHDKLIEQYLSTAQAK